MDDKKLRERGRKLIEQPEHETPMIPLKVWEDFPLRFTVEYPVKDFEAEVGFWAEAFGLRFMSLNDEYAICTDEAYSFTFSFQAAFEAVDLSHIKLQWFTDQLDDAIAALEQREVPHHVYFRSSSQRYIRTKSPAGVIVEVWSGMEDHCP